MKRFLGTVAIVALSATFLWAGQARADDPSVELKLQGTIEVETGITVSASDATTPGDLDQMTYSTLDLDDTTNSQSVAKVWELCNSLDGYTVTVTSGNDGELVGLDDDDYAVTYDLYYGATVVTYSDGEGTVTDEDEPALEYVDKLVAVTITGTGPFPAQTYEDILTFTIATNE